MKNRTLLLAAALFFAITPMIAATPAMTENSSKYTDTKDYNGVSAEQIYQYMLSFGFHVQTITPLSETSDVYVTTAEKRAFIVHIENASITGFEDCGY